MRQAQWCTPVIPPGDQETEVILGYTRPCLIEEFHMEDEDGGTMHPSVHGQAASATQTVEGWRRETGDTFLPFSITTGVKERRPPLKGKTQRALGSHTLRMKKYFIQFIPSSLSKVATLLPSNDKTNHK